MVEKTFYTKDGATTRTLTAQEVAEFAANGDSECKKAVLGEEIDKAADLAALKAALKKWVL